MDYVHEVLVVSDAADQTVNCSIHDLKTGALISTFKEGNSVRNGLAFIGEDVLISAFKGQPTLKFWTLNANYSEDYKMLCSGTVSCIAVSNCGTYFIAGIEKSILTYEVSSLNLLTTIQYHSQTVTCLRFSSDGSHFISGGNDGVVLVWLLSEVVAAIDTSQNHLKPRFTWMDHAAEVTDIFVGSLGIYARVVTASRDMTCRIYELETGYLLTTVHVDFPITAVTMDDFEYFLVLGSAEGHIYRINLFSVKDADVHYDNAEKKCEFLGHSSEITSLSISSTGKYLVSGSGDASCKVWDMTNFSCIRKLACNGSVTNAFVTLMPPGLKSERRLNPRIHITDFKKQYGSDVADLDCVTAKIQPKKLSLLHLAAPDEYFDSQILNSSSESLEAMLKGNLSVEEMSRINIHMYSYALSDTIVEIPESPDSREDSD